MSSLASVNYLLRLIDKQVLPLFIADLESECVTLIESKSLTTSELADAVPEDRARYHVFRFKHSHESDYLESNGESGLGRDVLIGES